MVRVRCRVGNRVSDLWYFGVNFELFVGLLGFIWDWSGFDVEVDKLGLWVLLVGFGVRLSVFWVWFKPLFYWVLCEVSGVCLRVCLRDFDVRFRVWD